MKIIISNIESVLDFNDFELLPEELSDKNFHYVVDYILKSIQVKTRSQSAILTQNGRGVVSKIPG
jgi:hypothetical protein